MLIATRPHGANFERFACGLLLCFASASAGPAIAADAPAAVRPASAAAPLQSRSEEQLRALFAKGTVTGADLVLELEAIRKLMGRQRNTAAVGEVLGPPEEGGGGSSILGEGIRIILKGAEELYKPYLASIGFGALDIHLKELINDPKLLLEERIKLPSAQDMSLAQMQRVVNMAAIVLAARATGKVLKRAQADFAHVEQEYGRLIERREAAAKLLFDLLLRGGGDGGSGSGSSSSSTEGPELTATFAADDLRYLRQSAAGRSVKDFSNDLGAQNLALRHLAKVDPGAWAEYKARSDGLLRSTRGYIRSAAGVAAFAALVANFSNETIGAIRDNRAVDILSALPFAWEFLREVLPLVKIAWSVGAAGVIELPSKAHKRFRVVDGDKAGAKSEDLGRAEDLFAAMKKRGVDALFSDSLFRTGFDGLLYKLYRCDKSEVGRMLDTAVPVAAREKLAASYLGVQSPRFSLANALRQPGETAREAELGDELLRNDHRERSTVPALGELQRLAASGFARWNNDQMLRLILANREGAAAQATLQLDEVRIRPVPTMQSVFAYESLVDSCSAQFGDGAVAVSEGVTSVSAAVATPTTPTTPPASAAASASASAPAAPASAASEPAGTSTTTTKPRSP